MLRTLFLLLLLPSLTITSTAQTKPTISVDERISIQLKNQSFGDVLTYLMQNYDLVFGFEESQLDADHGDFAFSTNVPAPIPADLRTTTDGEGLKVSVYYRPQYPVDDHQITLEYRNAPIKDVVDSLVAQMENYSWELKDGVINIFPSRGRNPLFGEFLDLHISAFRLDRPKLRVGMIKNTLDELPEVLAFTEKHKIRYRTSRSGFFGVFMREIPEPINATDIRLRDLLNRLTYIKRGGWRIAHCPKGDDHSEVCVDLDI